MQISYYHHIQTLSVLTLVLTFQVYFFWMGKCSSLMVCLESLRSLYLVNEETKAKIPTNYQMDLDEPEEKHQRNGLSQFQNQ